MATFAHETEDSIAIKLFTKQTRAKLEEPAHQLKPYKGTAKNMTVNGKVWTVVTMEPVYPRFYWLGMFLTAFAVVMAIWKGWPEWLMIPGVILTFAVILWSPEWMAFWFRQGMKSKGYRGTMKRVPTDELLKELVARLK